MLYEVITFQLHYIGASDVHFTSNSNYVTVGNESGLLTAGTSPSHELYTLVTIHADDGSNQTDQVKVYVIDSGQNTGLEALSRLTRVKLFPNPSSEKLNIILTGTVHPDAQLVLYHSSGAEVDRIPIVSENMQLHIGNYPNGMYILKVINGTEVITQRFIKN